MKLIFLLFFTAVYKLALSEQIPKLDIDEIVNKLAIETEICYEFISFQTLDDSSKRSILLLPVFAKKTDSYFALDSYLLLIESDGCSIHNVLFETSDENGMVSDAIAIREISTSIKSASDSNEKFFTVNLYFVGSSKIDPYERRAKSIYAVKEGTISRVVIP